MSAVNRLKVHHWSAGNVLNMTADTTRELWMNFWILHWIMGPFSDTWRTLSQQDTVTLVINSSLPMPLCQQASHHCFANFPNFLVFLLFNSALNIPCVKVNCKFYKIKWFLIFVLCFSFLLLLQVMSLIFSSTCCGWRDKYNMLAGFLPPS